MMRNENSVANATPRDAFSSFRYDPGCFVSKDLRRFGNTVPFSHIASAYAARHDFHEYFVIRDFRRRHLFNSYVSVVVVYGCKHLVHQRQSENALGFSCFYLFKQALSFFGRAVVVDYGSYGAYGGYGMFSLPNVSSKVYAYGAFLHAVIDEVEHFALSVDFWSASNHHGHWAAVNDLFEVVFAVVGFDYSCADFSGDSAAQRQVSCFAFFEFFSDCGDCHNWDCVVFACVHEACEVCEALVFVLASDEYGH